MSLVLDAIIVLIILVFAFLSAKKGFVRTLIEVVGFILAIVIALGLSTPIANGIYDTAVQPIVAKTVESAMSEGSATANAAVDAVWNKMPAFLTESSFFDVTKENITSTITDEVAANTATVTNSISDSFVKPIVTKLLSVLISVILVVILLFVVKLLAKYINKLFTFSVIGDINRTLGGILGVVKGVAISVIFCLIISLILSFTKDGFLIFTYDAINSSYLFKFIIGLSPFI